MSEQNVEVVRRVYDALARHQFPGELLDPEVEYVNPAGAVEPGVRRGVGEFRAAVDQVYEGWAIWQMEPEQFEAVADRVAVVVKYRSRGGRAALKSKAASRLCGRSATARSCGTSGSTILGKLSTLSGFLSSAPVRAPADRSAVGSGTLSITATNPRAGLEPGGGSSLRS